MSDRVEEFVDSDLDETPDFLQEKFDIGGSQLCVRMIGNKNNPAVVMLHGLQSHAGVWEKVAKELAERGYFVVMPDRRGHGLSDHTISYHLFDYVSDLNLVVKNYVNNPFTLVGHCESCYLTACYAGAFPECINQAIMIQYPVPARTQMDIATKTDLVRTFLSKNSVSITHPQFDGVEQAAERSRLGAPFPMPMDVAKHVAKRNISLGDDNKYSWRWHSKLLNYRVLYSTHDLEIIQESIKRITSPLKFIHGKDSSLIETNKGRIISYTSELNENSSQHLVSGGHYPHLESHYIEVVDVILS